MKYKIGDKVRIRSWESMEKEFGLSESGAIEIAYSFPEDMRYLCDNEYEIIDIEDDGYKLLDDSDQNEDWDISESMIEQSYDILPVIPPIPSKIFHDLQRLSSDDVHAYLLTIKRVIDNRISYYYSHYSISEDLNIYCFIYYGLRDENVFMISYNNTTMKIDCRFTDVDNIMTYQEELLTGKAPEFMTIGNL